MNDDFTEISLTRLTKRAAQRAEIIARESGERREDCAIEVPADDSLDDQTRLGSRSAQAQTRTSMAAAPSGTVPNPAPPSLVRPRLATTPAEPGASASREHYGARPAAPVIATRAPQQERPRTFVDPGAIDHAAQQRATRSRARRRALWLVVGATCTLVLVTTGILLVISALGR